MKFLSICSGIEAASVAFEPLGWKAVGFSEIDKFPCELLAHHYPDVPNYGDMSKWEEWPDMKIDLLCGGTPCQAFSVAGKRGGMSDERGNLSLTFCRIADRYQPEWVLWENVPGVLSDKDNAFGCFLAELCGAESAIEPTGGRWPNAGMVDGPKRTAAWRVLDAQYFGVAQRRRRVFVLAVPSSGERSVASVLFECEGVPRHSAPSRSTGQGTPTGAKAGVGGGGEQVVDAPEVMCTLRGTGSGFDRPGNAATEHETYLPVIQGCDVYNGELNPHPSLNQSHNTGSPGYSNQELFSQRGAGLVGEQVAHTLQTTCDDYSRADGFNMVVEPQGCDVYNGELTGDTAATLTKASGGANTSGPKVMSIQGNAIREKATSGCGGKGRNDDDLSFTLNTADKHAVAFSISSQNSGAMKSDNPKTGHKETDVARTVDATDMSPAKHQGGNAIVQPVAFDERNIHLWSNKNRETCPSLTATDYKGAKGVIEETPRDSVNMQVRRLTPVECERLQGFEDNYTLIPYRGKPADKCPDGPRYKSLGNSWAVPCARWIAERIMKEEAYLKERNRANQTKEE